MKTFKRILKIIAWVIGGACVFFVLLVYLILTSLFSVDTPEGCDPSMPTSACDYIDEKFEKELQNLPPVAALPPLEKRPVFWLGKGRFAKGVKFDHYTLRTKPESGLDIKTRGKKTFFTIKICQGATIDTTRSTARRTKGG